jgi:hypothetical protein
MIDHDVLAKNAAQAVFLQPVAVSQTNAQETQNHIVSVYDDRIVTDTNAVSGRTLTGNRDIGIADYQRRFEFDIAGYPENHDAWSCSLNGGSQASGPIVAEMGYLHDLAAAPARRKTAETFGFGEGQGLGARRARYHEKAKDYAKGDSQDTIPT